MSVIRDYWLKNHIANGDMGIAICPAIRCADGFSVSVQAGFGDYCRPRTYLADGGYFAWEVGFPSCPDEILAEYADDPSRPCETVYSYVPTDIVDGLIAKHGGLAP